VITYAAGVDEAVALQRDAQAASRRLEMLRFDIRHDDAATIFRMPPRVSDHAPVLLRHTENFARRREPSAVERFTAFYVAGFAACARAGSAIPALDVSTRRRLRSRARIGADGSTPGEGGRRMSVPLLDRPPRTAISSAAAARSTDQTASISRRASTLSTQCCHRARDAAAARPAIDEPELGRKSTTTASRRTTSPL